MEKLIKWMESNLLIAVAGVILVSLLAGFLAARYIMWGWLITLLIGAGCGLFIRRVVVKKMEEQTIKPIKEQ